MATLNGDDTNNNLIGTLGEINTIHGLGGNDNLYGGYLRDYISGGSGNDYISSYEGDDFINDSSGSNTINSGAGDDTVDLGYAGLGLAATNTVSLDLGDDLLYAGGQIDIINGGQGIDRVSYVYSSAAVTVSLQRGIGVGGFAESDTFRSIEDLIGSSYADNLIGSGAFNTIYGNGGDDFVTGGAGGDDLDGAAGIDTLAYRKSDMRVVVNLLTGDASGGDAQGDQFYNFENVDGSELNDSLTGDANANRLRGFGGNDAMNGGDGNDELSGLDGNDNLNGGIGDDDLFGGNGNDLLFGNIGADELYGGLGADKFVFKTTADSTNAVAGRDIIYDFLASESDRIDLSAIDANSAASGNQTFTFIGAAAFSGVNGQVRIRVDASDTFVFGDINGDSVADFTVQFDDAINLNASMFIL